MSLSTKNKEGIFYLLIGVILSLLVFSSSLKGFFSGIETSLEDTLFGESSLNGDVVIIAIDDASLSEIGQWPWPRAKFAEIFKKLESVSPKVLGFDVMLSEKSRYGEGDDYSLARVLNDINYPIIFPVEIRGESLNKNKEEIIIKPLQIFFGENLHYGHVNLTIDPDGVIRRFPFLVKTEEAGEFLAFSSLTVSKSGKDIAPEYKGVPRIYYAGGPGTIKTYSLKDIVEGDDISYLQNKIIFIGSTAPDLHDEQITPTSRGGTLMSGVEIQAQIANMLLEDLKLFPISRTILFFWIFLVGVILSTAFIFRLSHLSIIILWFFTAIFSLSGAIILFEKGLIVNMVHTQMAGILPLISLFVFRYTLGEKESRVLKKTFGKYVSPQVLDKIMENPEKVELGGEEKNITVLFSDIRGFTSLSEKTSPAELVEILNEYFTEMTDEILKYGGVLDKYIGDAVMAFWGAPLDDSDQADNALKAAIGMVERLEKFNEKLRERGKPEIKNGVGIFTGPAIVGNVGSKDRFDYTVIGDTVNSASRLEGVTKQYGVSIIFGETTKRALKSNIAIKHLDKVSVKGKTEMLDIYTLK